MATQLRYGAKMTTIFCTFLADSTGKGIFKIGQQSWQSYEQEILLVSLTHTVYTLKKAILYFLIFSYSIFLFKTEYIVELGSSGVIEKYS